MSNCCKEQPLRYTAETAIRNNDINRSAKKEFMKNANDGGNANLLRPYTIKELTQLYCVTRHTMSNWLKRFEPEIGVRIGNVYTVAQITIIFDKLGWPPEA